MDIQKQVAFETWLFSTEKFKFRNKNFLFMLDEYGNYEDKPVLEHWETWQAAKAQAVPEGFVLIKASDRDQEMLELIDQRDHMESQAEELKDKLQALYGVDFGEHSSCNFPFQNAIDYDDSDLVLVPKKATKKMLDAGYEAHDGFFSNGAVQDVYVAMIEAQEPTND